VCLLNTVKRMTCDRREVTMDTTLCHVYLPASTTSEETRPAAPTD
jgi:hypothetical protein